MGVQPDGVGMVRLRKTPPAARDRLGLPAQRGPGTRPLDQAVPLEDPRAHVDGGVVPGVTHPDDASGRDLQGARGRLGTDPQHVVGLGGETVGEDDVEADGHHGDPDGEASGRGEGHAGCAGSGDPSCEPVPTPWAVTMAMVSSAVGQLASDSCKVLVEGVVADHGAIRPRCPHQRPAADHLTRRSHQRGEQPVLRRGEGVAAGRRHQGVGPGVEMSRAGPVAAAVSARRASAVTRARSSPKWKGLAR